MLNNSGIPGDQNMACRIIRIRQSKASTTDNTTHLPLSPKATLSWMGYVSHRVLLTTVNLENLNFTVGYWIIKFLVKGENNVCKLCISYIYFSESLYNK